MAPLSYCLLEYDGEPLVAGCKQLAEFLSLADELLLISSGTGEAALTAGAASTSASTLGARGGGGGIDVGTCRTVPPPMRRTEPGRFIVVKWPGDSTTDGLELV